jgi:hypothetical protein
VRGKDGLLLLVLIAIYLAHFLTHTSGFSDYAARPSIRGNWAQYKESRRCGGMM